MTKKRVVIYKPDGMVEWTMGDPRSDKRMEHVTVSTFNRLCVHTDTAKYTYVGFPFLLVESTAPDTDEL